MKTGFPPGFNPFVTAGGYHRPNHFSVKQRVAHAILAALLLAYGGFGVYIDDLFIPGKRSGVHLHGMSAWLMYGACVSAASVFLALVIDHYDRRNNEHHYERFKEGATVVGWSFFAAAFVWTVLGSLMRVWQRSFQ